MSPNDGAGKPPVSSYARICGALYLYIIVAGMFAELFVRGKLVVSGDAAATARNISTNESLFRLLRRAPARGVW